MEKMGAQIDHAGVEQLFWVLDRITGEFISGLLT